MAPVNKPKIKQESQTCHFHEQGKVTITKLEKSIIMALS